MRVSASFVGTLKLSWRYIIDLAKCCYHHWYLEAVPAISRAGAEAAALLAGPGEYLARSKSLPLNGQLTLLVGRLVLFTLHLLPSGGKTL